MEYLPRRKSTCAPTLFGEQGWCGEVVLVGEGKAGLF